jgi:hypothetical protein
LPEGIGTVIGTLTRSKVLLFHKEVAMKLFKILILLLLTHNTQVSVAAEIQPGITQVELLNLIQQPNEDLESVETFMNLFSEESRWIAPMIYQSRSLQGGGFNSPRVLFISPPEDLANEHKPFEEKLDLPHFMIFSLTGSSSFRNGDNIEIVGYDSSRSPDDRLSFFDYDFDKPFPMRLTERNPVKCLKCHGSNPRLIHDPVGRWPGMLNSNTNFGRSIEDDMFDWRDRNTHTRFSFLQHLSGPFSANTRLNQAARIANLNRMVDLIIKSPDYTYYKYAIAGALVGCESLSEFIPADMIDRHLNLDRIEFEKLVDLEAERSWNSHDDILELYKLDSQRREDEIFDRFDIINKNFTQAPVYLLRWIFESRGLGIGHWFSGTQEGYYQHSQNFRGQEPIEALKLRDPTLSFIIEPPNLRDLPANHNDAVNRLNSICSDLKGRSLREFSGKKVLSPVRPKLKELSDRILPLDHYTSTPSGRESCTNCHSGFLADYSGPSFRRSSFSYPVEAMVCAHCHSDSEERRVGPYIPFHDEQLMNSFLTEAPYMRAAIDSRLSDDSFENLTHMPPIFLLPDKDRNKLKDYFGFGEY